MKRRLSRRRLLIGGAEAGIALAGTDAVSRLLDSEQEAGTLPGIRIFDYAIEGNDKPLTTSAALTRYAPGRFDLVVAQKNQLKAQWSQIHAANPALVWAVYMNATHTTNPNLDPSWYVRDANGEKVRAGGEWTNNFLMDPLSGWTAFRENETAKLVAESGAPAVYADELGVGPIYSVSAPPIDPRTDVAWTWGDWMIQMNAILDGLNAKLTVPVWCNGLGNGNRFFTAPTSTLLSRSEGALAESFLRGAAQPATFYPTATAWDREVRMIEAAGPKAMACTKIWAAATSDVKARVLRWALGTFLLGAASGAMWYSTAVRATTVTPWRSEWSQAKALGAPLGPRTGTQRQFENGVVTVNNATHDATIALT